MRPETTELLERVHRGDLAAREELVQRLYPELHARAAAYMRGERDDHTLQPTALVNEAYVRVFGGAPVEFKDRDHVMAVAALAMRRILIDYARRNRSRSAPAHWSRLLALKKPADTHVLEVDGALNEIAVNHPREAEIAVMRFFGEMTVPQVARALGLSVSTVEADWRFARAELRRLIGAGKKP